VAIEVGIILADSLIETTGLLEIHRSGGSHESSMVASVGNGPSGSLC
jgi:hypothetical protein